MDKYANIMDSYAVNGNNIKYDKKPSDDDFAEMNRKTKLVAVDWKISYQSHQITQVILQKRTLSIWKKK